MQRCFPHFFLLKLPYPTSNCVYIIISIPIHCLRMVMNVIRRNFSAVSNSVMACYLNHTSSQPSMSTGIELELWIAVSSRLPMVEGRYHVTSWNQYCPVFITLIKTMTEETKHFCPCSYVKFLGFQCCYQLDSEPVCICMY